MNIVAAHLVLLMALTLVTRSLPRFLCPEARGMDTYYHLLAARSIKNNGMKLPKTLKELILPGIYDYPPLLHYLWALFPLRIQLSVEKFSSAVIDAVHAAAVYFFSLYILSVYNPSQITSQLAFCTTLIFIMSPALLSIGAGPRAYQGTPRTLGELFFSLSFCFAMLAYLDGLGSFTVLSIFSGALLFLTSKFGVQVMVFFCIVLSIVTLDFYWLLLLLGMFAVAILISKGHYAIVFAGHIEHSQYYLQVISKRYFLLAQRNSWNDLKKTLLFAHKRPIDAAKNLILYHSYFHLIMNHPLLLAVAYTALFKGQSAENPLNGLLLSWIAAGCIVFLLTSTKPLLFLGEAERYLEYTLLPQVLYLALNPMNGAVYSLILLYFLLLFGIFVIGFRHAYQPKMKNLPAFKGLVQFIRENDRVKNILPMYLSDAVQLALESGKGVAHFPANFRKKFMSYDRFVHFYPKTYPFPNENMKDLMVEYGFDTLYFSNKDLEKAQDAGIVYNTEGFKTFFKNDQYTVLGIENPSIESTVSE